MATVNISGVTFTNIQGIIFDKDGTLQDSHSFLRELAHKRARLIDAQIPGIGEPLLMAFGMQDGKLDTTGLMAVGSHQENEIAAAAYIAETGRSWFESLEIAQIAFKEAESYLQRDSQTSPMFPGTLTVIKSLADAGLQLGILSADSTAGVKDFVASNQLEDYIKLCMGVDSAGLTKPNPALFSQACETLGLEPATTLMVGDSVGDIKMAKDADAAGAIGICWGNNLAPHLKIADLTISNLNEIKIAS